MLGLRSLTLISGVAIATLGASTAHAVPIEGTAPGAMASLNVAAPFIYESLEGDLTESTIIFPDSESTGFNSLGFSTVNSVEMNSFQLNDLAGVAGAFLTADFSAFMASDPVFGDVNSGGTFSFDPTGAILTDFNTGAGAEGNQTTFTIEAVGDVMATFLEAPTEGFATSTFSAVINGSSIMGQNNGSLSATLTVPAQFDIPVPGPAPIALIGLGLAALCIQRGRANRKA